MKFKLVAFVAALIVAVTAVFALSPSASAQETPEEEWVMTVDHLRANPFYGEDSITPVTVISGPSFLVEAPTGNWMICSENGGSRCGFASGLEYEDPSGRECRDYDIFDRSDLVKIARNYGSRQYFWQPPEVDPQVTLCLGFPDSTGHIVDHLRPNPFHGESDLQYVITFEGEEVTRASVFYCKENGDCSVETGDRFFHPTLNRWCRYYSYFNLEVFNLKPIEMNTYPQEVFVSPGGGGVSRHCLRPASST